jgi:hypothetical protein
MISTGTVNDLIESASRRGNIPNSQMTYLTTDFLAMANEELLAYCLPVLHARREDYYLEEAYFDPNSPDAYIGNPDGAKDAAWLLPTYAMVSSLRDVQAVGPGGSFYSLGRMQIDSVPNSVTQGWYFYGNYLAFHYSNIASIPAPVAIRAVFHVRPNLMNVIEECARIFRVIIPGEEYEVSMPSVPPAYNYSNPLFYDFARGRPGYEILARHIPVRYNVTPISTGMDREYPTWSQYQMYVAPGTFLPFTLPNGLPTGTQAIPTSESIFEGDWICPTGTQCVVPLPLEMHALLAQRMVVKFLEAQGDQEQLAQSRNSLSEMANQIPLLIQPRVEGKPKKLINAQGLWRRWRW